MLCHGRTLERDLAYFGDVDYLRDANDRLIGFSYLSWSRSEPDASVQRMLLAQSHNVRMADGMLVILLQPAAYEVECVQAMGTWIYRDATDIALVIPDWGFGDLGFQLAEEPPPWVEF